MVPPSGAMLTPDVQHFSLLSQVYRWVAQGAWALYTAVSEPWVVP